MAQMTATLLAAARALPVAVATDGLDGAELAAVESQAAGWTCPTSVPKLGECFPHSAGSELPGFVGDAAACCAACHALASCAAFT
eukprot:COSAG02_NODE_30717_length_546_cov_1.201342_1_plen_84_part_01